MKIIIPMAGLGSRFVRNGYKDPKPLIEVNKKKIIEYILDMFTSEDEITFICNEKHINETSMRNVLTRLRPNSKILTIPQHKKGPIYTILPFFNLIDDDEEIIISYCDNPMVWNFEDFKSHVKENNLDGCILTHTGMHPHTLNSTKMAFLKLDEEGNLLEIKEKECYTDDPMSEHASTGVYYFKSGKILKECFLNCIEKNITYNGEYYVTLAYNFLVEQGKKVGYYDTEFVTVFGTPEEVESFEAWKTILTSGQVKNEEDLLACYDYWKRYHDKK